VAFPPVASFASLPWLRPTHRSKVVKEVEEQALVGVVAVDIEERANALIKQLEDVNHHGVRMYSFSCF
jgi:hypothetical protein